MQNLPKLLEAGVKLVGSLSQGLLQNMPAIITSITQLMAKLLATIVQNLPQMLQKGIELIGKLAAGLIQAIPQAVKAIVDLNDGMVKIFQNFDWLGLGRDIINGVIKGLKAAGSALWDAITEIARGAFDSVKRFFGIGSPSKLMRDEIGRFIPAGIAVGIEDNMKPLTTAMHDIADTATTSFDTDVMMSAKTSGAITGGGTVNYGGVTINVTAQDVQQSRDFVDWLENQLVMRQNNRKAAALA
jgi:phage-related protein